MLWNERKVKGMKENNIEEESSRASEEKDQKY